MDKGCTVRCSRLVEISSRVVPRVSGRCLGGGALEPWSPGAVESTLLRVASPWEVTLLQREISSDLGGGLHSHMTNTVCTVQFRFPTTTPQFGPIYGVRVRSISNFVRCRATGLPLSLRLLRLLRLFRLLRLLRLASTCFTLERFLCPPAACIHTGTDYVHAHYLHMLGAYYILSTDTHPLHPSIYPSIRRIDPLESFD